MTISNKIPFIAGNWKMYMTRSQAADLVSPIVKSTRDLSGAEVVVIPPYTALSEVLPIAWSTPPLAVRSCEGQSCLRSF